MFQIFLQIQKINNITVKKIINKQYKQIKELSIYLILGVNIIFTSICLFRFFTYARSYICAHLTNNLEYVQNVKKKDFLHIFI